MKKLFCIIFTLSFLISCSQKSTKTDLSGEWKFRMDVNDEGIDQKWFATEFTENVKLPGSMTENGKGFNVGPDTKWTGGIQNPNWMKDPNYEPYLDSADFKFPFWLQPVKRFVGAAWYQKKINIPQNWNGKKIILTLERSHWESTVWVNDSLAGMQNSLGTPHRFDLTPFVKPGQQILSIRVDNRIKTIDPGENSHSISDHTQSNWNGIVGEISIEAMPEIHFSDIQLIPFFDKNVVVAQLAISNPLPESKGVRIEIVAKNKTGKQTVKISKKIENQELKTGENSFKILIDFDDKLKYWDEFNPNLYDITFKLSYENTSHKKTLTTGFRNLKIVGSRFTINDRPVFIRGTLECAIFPKTGFPPTDKNEWLRIMNVAKSHGLNNIRFHSWCPPKAAFEAADETGMYLQVECSSWANQSTSLGDGKPIDEYIRAESIRMVKEYGNHPSFIMMAYGNEPGGRNFRNYLKEFVKYWKETDPRRLYTSAAGWPELPENDYHNIPQPRIQGWGEGLKSIINGQAPRSDYDWTNKMPYDKKPVISHEIGQWCVYPNFREISKYTGNLKAKNFEIFQKSLNFNGMGNLADSFLLASGKLQALCYKADIEAALRTPGMAGFQLLDLHDFPGQGTALVGVLDPFWEEKGYISPKEFNRFCNATVPLVRLPKMVYYEDETLVVSAEVAHFGQSEIKNTSATWALKDTSGAVFSEGKFDSRDIPVDNCIQLGKIEQPLPVTGKPKKLVLEIAVGGFSNSWDIWVYPRVEKENLTEVKITQKPDKATLDFLEQGGNVLLTLGQGKIAPEMGGNVGVGFSSIFWNTAWTNNQKPHTLGILCNPNHPALELFPSEYHSNWQWHDAMSHADAILLKEFPTEIKPIVRIIDDWVSNRPLALIFEAKVGNGKIIVCGADMVTNLKNRAETSQLRASLLNYMNSAKFNPTATVARELIEKIAK